jgi:hypothetical protein
MCGAARPSCRFFTLSLRTSGNAPTASMPAAVRPHCILVTRNSGIMAVFLTAFGAEDLFEQHEISAEQFMISSESRNNDCTKIEVDKSKKTDSGRVLMISLVFARIPQFSGSKTGLRPDPWTL